MKKSVAKTLYFLRLTDEAGLLSITNIGCIVVLTKVALNPQPSIVDMGTLLITLSLYFGKAHINKHKQKLSDENKTAIEEMKTKIQQVADKTSGVAAAVGMRAPIVK